jgi:hypothetical protein
MQAACTAAIWTTIAHSVSPTRLLAFDHSQRSIQGGLGQSTVRQSRGGLELKQSRVDENPVRSCRRRPSAGRTRLGDRHQVEGTRQRRS